ncbi:GspE family protein [Staphylococcus succinus]|nr:GspE family protein [Staphylococcus succinus]
MIKGVTQVSINEKAGINYETSFKAILRCDPDVILIGEIRDASIAKYVIQASLSGHLVLSTIHANDCKGALLRLREMNISVQEICQSIKSIINQRLVTTLQHNRQLIYEQLNQPDINYFFENNHSLPKDFNKLSYYLNGMSRAGVICEETVDRYI